MADIAQARSARTGWRQAWPGRVALALALLYPTTLVALMWVVLAALFNAPTAAMGTAGLVGVILLLAGGVGTPVFAAVAISRRRGVRSGWAAAAVWCVTTGWLAWTFA